MNSRNFLYDHRSALHIAVEEGNVVIVRLLLSNDKLDINEEYIFNTKFL